MSPNLWIFSVMLTAGLVGGCLNFARSPKADDKTSAAQSFLGGLVASFMVPLFLNMISSNLISGIRGADNKPGDTTGLFVLAGFCLAAAVFSKNFIDTVSDRILRETKETRQQLNQFKKEVGPIIEKETEQEPQEQHVARTQKGGSDLSEEKRQVLTALGNPKYTLRTRTGISREVGLQKDDVNRIIKELEAEGLVRKVNVMVDDAPRPRWYLGHQARAALGARGTEDDKQS